MWAYLGGVVKLPHYTCYWFQNNILNQAFISSAMNKRSWGRNSVTLHTFRSLSHLWYLCDGTFSSWALPLLSEGLHGQIIHSTWLFPLYAARRNSVLLKRNPFSRQKAICLYAEIVLSSCGKLIYLQSRKVCSSIAFNSSIFFGFDMHILSQ